MQNINNAEVSRRAKYTLRESKRLLRRAGKRLPQTSQAQVSASVNAVEEALRSDNTKKLAKLVDELAGLTDKYLHLFRKPAWLESVESIVIALAIAMLLRGFMFEAFKIPSGSMIPTLAIGDQIFVNKYIFGIRVPFTPIRIVDFSMPKRGEVVVFICPQPPNDDYIKRVIGLPGDEIRVQGGTVYVNDVAIERKSLGVQEYWDRTPLGEWYTFSAEAFEEQHGTHTYTVLDDPPNQAADHGPTVVPEGHLFMMGDNRDHSYDSRNWGTVPYSNVLGRSTFVWLSFGAKGFASERIGTWID